MRSTSEVIYGNRALTEARKFDRRTLLSDLIGTFSLELSERNVAPNFFASEKAGGKNFGSSVAHSMLKVSYERSTVKQSHVEDVDDGLKADWSHWITKGANEIEFATNTAKLAFQGRLASA